MPPTIIDGANLKPSTEVENYGIANPRSNANRGDKPRVDRVPTHSWKEFGVALIIFTASCLYLLLFRRYTSIEPDEGIILQGAQRILGGQVLYRDFFSFLTPGSYYFVAGLFKIFGSSILTARTAMAVYGGLLPTLTYLLARRVSTRRSALMVSCLVAITAVPYRFLVLHNWDSTLLACFAVYCAVRWLETAEGGKRKAEGRNQKAAGSHSSLITHHSSLVSGLSPLVSRLSSPSLWALATGSLASLTCLFEQSKGGGLVLGLALGFLLIHCTYGEHRFFTRKPLATLARKDSHHRRHREHGEQNSVVSVPSVVKGAFPSEWISLAAGFLWPFLLTISYFAAHHAVGCMLADWLWPLHHYSAANRVPFGYQNWSDQTRQAIFGGTWIERLIATLIVTPCFLIPVLPLSALGLLAYWLMPFGRRKLPPEQWRYDTLVSSAISGLLLSVVVSRADILHFVYLAPLFYLPLAWIFDGIGLKLPASARHILTLLILASFTLLGAALVFSARGGHDRLQSRRGTLETSRPDSVVPYVQAHAPAGSKMLVYPYLPLYYYFTATYSPTRYDYLQPGMHTREQEEEAIREIASDRTFFALFEPAFNEKIATSWPNTPIEDVANDPLGDYLLRHYHSCKVLHSAGGWRFLFMVRNDLTCP
jgi:hypothetical protein